MRTALSLFTGLNSRYKTSARRMRMMWPTSQLTVPVRNSSSDARRLRDVVAASPGTMSTNGT